MPDEPEEPDQPGEQDRAAQEKAQEKAQRAAARARIEQQQTWVDLQVRQAMERGDFDNLPGAGKPIEGLGEHHDPDWWLKKLVERERITVLPPSIALRKEDADLDAALDRLFVGEDPDTKFGQFAAADLGNYTALVQSLVQHLASVSRVPFHYFLLNGGQAPSGESIKSAEAGLVSKARERQTHFGEVWEDVIRLAFRVLGDPRAEASAAETIWRDAEYRTEGEHVDALLKLKSLGVPVQQLWEDAGYSPQQIERFDQMREDDARIEATSMGMAPDAVMAAAPMAALEPDDDEAPDPQQG